VGKSRLDIHFWWVFFFFRVRIRKGRVPFNPTDVSGFPERRRMQTMAEERERERKETKYKCLVKKHMKKKKMNEKK